MIALWSVSYFLIKCGKFLSLFRQLFLLFQWNCLQKLVTVARNFVLFYEQLFILNWDFVALKKESLCLFRLFQQTKTQIKSVISTHPIEIFMIAAFALGIWFVDMNSEKDHLAYWLFEPMLLAFIYLSRPYSWYRFHGLCLSLLFSPFGKWMIMLIFIAIALSFGAQILLRYWCY